MLLAHVELRKRIAGRHEEVGHRGVRKLFGAYVHRRATIARILGP